MQVITEKGLRPDEVAVIGDGEDDRLGAAAAGCRFFPVGEARGGDGVGEIVYTLPELAALLTGRAVA